MEEELSSELMQFYPYLYYLMETLQSFERRVSTSLISQVKDLDVLTKSKALEEALLFIATSKHSQTKNGIGSRDRIKACPTLESLDFYDFDNCKGDTKTSAGLDRIPTHELIEDLERSDWLHAKLPAKAYDPAQLLCLNFPSQYYTRSELVTWLMNIFAESEVQNFLKVSDDVLHAFLVQVARRYPKNPYHNFTHAFNLAQLSQWAIVSDDDLCDLLGLEERAAILISCLCHDLNHPGMNNEYMIKSDDPRALAYFGRSVLEQHHVSVFFEILEQRVGKTSLNIFANMEVAVAK